MKTLLNARDLQAEPWEMNRRQAYEVLHRVGVRITPRRLVVLRSSLERFLVGGEENVANDAGNGSSPPTGAASRG